MPLKPFPVDRLRSMLDHVEELLRHPELVSADARDLERLKAHLRNAIDERTSRRFSCDSASPMPRC